MDILARVKCCLSFEGTNLLAGKSKTPAVLIFYLIAIAGAVLCSIFSPRTRGDPRKKGKFRGYLCLIMILAGASLFCFYRLGQHPPTVCDYETSNGLSALQIIQGDPDYFKVLWSFQQRSYADSPSSPFFVYPLAVLFQITDVSLVSLRSIGVFWTLGSVLIFYFLVKLLFDQNRALLAAFLLTISPWFLATARLGIYSSLTVFYALFILFIFFLSLKKSSLYYPLLGISLAFNSYFYVPIKILLPLIILVWLHSALLIKKFFKKNIFGFILFLALFLLFSDLIADPIEQVTAIRIHDHYAGTEPRMTNSFNLNMLVQDLLTNLDHLLHTLFYTNTSVYFPAPAAPLINRGIFLLAILGIGLSVGRWKQSQYFFLLIWLFLAILPAIIISPYIDRAVARRGILLSPLICILTAISLKIMINAVNRLGKIMGKILSGIGITTFLLIISTVNLQLYFNTFSNAWNWQKGEKEFSQRMANLLEQGYRLEIILKKYPVFAPRVIDFLVYPQVRQLYYFFVSADSGHYRQLQGENPHYRYWRTSQFDEALQNGREFPQKTGILIANSGGNRPLVDRIRDSDPLAQIDEFKDSDDRVIGFQYLIEPSKRKE